MEQEIEKQRFGIFHIGWRDDKGEIVDNSRIALNFRPIIQEFKLEPPYVLLHWQARPKGLRRWGLYDGGADQYFGVDWDQFNVNDLVTFKTLQIDENEHRVVPTAVNYFPDAVLQHTKDGIFMQYENGESKQ